MQTIQRKGKAATTHLHEDLVPFAGGPADEIVVPYLLTTRHGCLLFSELKHGVGGRTFSVRGNHGFGSWRLKGWTGKLNQLLACNVTSTK